MDILCTSFIITSAGAWQHGSAGGGFNRLERHLVDSPGSAPCRVLALVNALIAGLLGAGAAVGTLKRPSEAAQVPTQCKLGLAMLAMWLGFNRCTTNENPQGRARTGQLGVKMKPRTTV